MEKETKILNVDGISCGHCENAVKKAVGALDGVTEVRVDLEGKSVTVEFESQSVMLPEIEEAIEDQGYEVVK